MKKKLRVIADKICILEQKCQRGENMNENLAKIEELIKNLSFDEILEIDEYLISKNISILTN